MGKSTNFTHSGHFTSYVEYCENSPDPSDVTRSSQFGLGSGKCNRKLYKIGVTKFEEVGIYKTGRGLNMIT